MRKEKLLSLYDYLGKPAGKNTGKNVSIMATKCDIPLVQRRVENNNYQGNVALYPEWFLDVVFMDPFENREFNTSPGFNPDDLPF
jgi:hypothetical protein